MEPPPKSRYLDFNFQESIKIVKNAEKSEFQMLRGEGMGWFQVLILFLQKSYGSVNNVLLP